MDKTVNPDHKMYHPKWHRRRMPIFWWLRHPAYTKFISRELTSVLVAYSAIMLLLQVWAVGQGEETYDRFLSWLRFPPAIVFHVVVWLILLFHTVTWLNLAPKALVMRFGGRRVPDALVLVAHYLAWFGASGLVAWILLGR
jgi:fumarate reductase subunit C